MTRLLKDELYLIPPSAVERGHQFVAVRIGLSTTDRATVFGHDGNAEFARSRRVSRVWWALVRCNACGRRCANRARTVERNVELFGLAFVPLCTFTLRSFIASIDWLGVHMPCRSATLVIALLATFG